MYFKEEKAGTAKYGTRLLWGEEPGHECEQHSTLDSVTCENSGIAALIGELRRVLVKEGTSSPARLDDFANVADDAQSYHHASDRKSVVKGKSVSVRVALGGRRIIKKNTPHQVKKKTIY